MTAQLTRKSLPAPVMPDWLSACLIMVALREEVIEEQAVRMNM